MQNKTNPSYTVERISHWRYDGHGNMYPSRYMRKNGIPIHPRGGHTEVVVAFGERRVVSDARCNLVDNFNRKRAVSMALARAVFSYKWTTLAQITEEQPTADKELEACKSTM